MLFENLNCVSVLQKKLQSYCLSPNICHLCLSDSEDLQHLFFTCSFAMECWQPLFLLFNLAWVFGDNFKDNTLQILIGPALKKKPRLLWTNAIKVVLSEIWFERNQRVFHNKASSWIDRFEIAKINASSWCILNRIFEDYTIQALNLNWRAFLQPSK